MKDDLLLFTGNANPVLAQSISAFLGLPMGRACVRKFAYGEVNVEIQESPRGSDVFLIQSTCPPVNDHLMELLVMLDAIKRASADRITAVIPYYGYSRQDRKVAPRAPISAKLVADLIQVAGAHRVVTVDLHANQIQGFFDIPVDNLYAIPSLIESLRKRITDQVVIVSPDVGGARRARYLAERWRPAANIAIIDKRRPRPGVAEVVNIIGKVRDRVAILMDDMIDSGGTIVSAAQALLDHGAKAVYAACTHGVFSGAAAERLQKSQITKLFVTATIPRTGDPATFTKFETVSLAPLIGTAIRNIHEGESVSSLFDGIDSLN
jgi:ribose-phosphate pyrophosphokinase